MSEGPAKGRQRLHLLRSFYEWGAIAFATLALACILDWALAACSSLGNTGPLTPFGTVLSAQRGSIVLSSDFDISTSSLKARAADPEETDRTSDRVLDIPGLHFRMQRYYFEHNADHHFNSVYWALEISLILPFIVSAVLAIACFRGYKSIQQKPLSRDPISENLRLD
jgi:hypothetical protein